MKKLVFYLALLQIIHAFDDIEKICKKGEKIGSIQRNAWNKTVDRIEATCKTMSFNEDIIKSISCQEQKPLLCNGHMESCPNNTWLAGLKFFQLSNDSSSDLLVPTCCSSDKVIVDKCWSKRLNSVNSEINSVLEDNTVYQNFTCWALLGSSHTVNKKIVDFILKVDICNYRASDEDESKLKSSSSPTWSTTESSKIIKSSGSTKLLNKESVTKATETSRQTKFSSIIHEDLKKKVTLPFRKLANSKN